jgi:hypothetical protein
VNGLVMLDIDHVENPMEIWEKLQQNEELMKRVVLVHITSSGHGIRIIFTANVKDGNLADNIIVFAAALGYKADSSCIDATRNSFAPKEDEILFIDEERLFTYYDEEFDREYTPMYREKKTQPLYHQFPADDGAAGADRAKAAAVANANAQQGAGPVRPMDAASLADGNHNCQLSILNSQLTWRGYDVQAIIDCRYADKLPCADDSNRHTESLKLATDLLLMLDGDRAAVQRIVEAQPWVQEIIDERNENVAQTVESAVSCVKEKEKKYAGSLPSKAMQAAIEKVTGKTYRELTSPSPSEGGENGGGSISSPLGRSGEVFVSDCNLESDLEMYFPDQYVPSDSERMLLYRELDNTRNDQELEAYRQRLVDRFGPLPPQAEELLQVVALRRYGKSLGCEKIMLKQGRMFLYFVSNARSPFYQSEAFGRIIEYATTNVRRCNLREQNGKRSMVVTDVPTVGEAVNVLKAI